MGCRHKSNLFIGTASKFGGCLMLRRNMNEENKVWHEVVIMKQYTKKTHTLIDI